MSLRVWLPLTKDLRNQGLDDVTVTNNGATFNSAGKLGGCYQFNGSNNYIYATKNIYNSSYSYSLWFYTVSSSTTQCLGCCRNGVGVGFAIFLINGKLRIDCGGSSQWTTSYTYPTNTWTHLTITFENTTVKYYINGEHQQSYTAGLTQANWGTIFSVGASQANGGSYGNYLNGKLNDVRVYDHCLSEMEVKQLSQGLILHYPLNRGGWGQENLGNTSASYSNLTNGQTISLSGWGGDAGTVTCYHSGGYNNYPYKVYHKTATGSGGIYYKTANDIDIKANTTYTMSVYIKASRNFSDVAYSFNINRGSDNHYINFGQTIQFTTDWKRIVRTFTTDANAAGKYGEMSIIYDDEVTDYYVYYSGFKIEEGSIATPWCPSIDDTLYTAMGLNSTTEYDTSGYCNNGTWYGTHTNTSDTPKYTVSTTAAGGASTYLEGPILPAEVQTAALWIKCKKSQAAAIFNDKTSGLQIGLLNSILYMNSKAATPGFTTTHWKDDDWNHVVVTYDGTTRKAYINGEAETQSGASNYYIHGADNCWLWNRSYNNNYPFNGSLSDFRIYATALSASDVKSLYQNCATIDPDGTIRGQIRS